MGKITEKIALFNRAYALALEKIGGQPPRKGASPAVELAALIRLKIAAGATDVEIIAADAIRAVTAAR